MQNIFTKISLVSFLFIALAVPAQAADFRAPTNQKSGNLQISDSLETHNLYAAGAMVTVNASPEKDLTVAGGTINVNSNVGDDLLAAGGNLYVRGDIGGSARMVGGNISVESKNIAEDLVLAGGTIYISRDTVIKGDLVGAGSSFIIDGTVEGNIKVNASSLTINGRVAGNVEATVQQFFELGPDARLEGNLIYSSRELVERDPAAQVNGQVNYTPLKGRALGFAAIFTVGFLIRILAALLVAFVLFNFFKTGFNKFVRGTGEGFWGNAGRGLIGVIVMPIVGILLFVTVIGYYLSFILLGSFALMLMLSCIVGAAYFGSWIVMKIEKKELRIDYATITVGVVLLYIIKLIPILGWIAAAVLVLAGFGSILKVLSKSRKGE